MSEFGKDAAFAEAPQPQTERKPRSGLVWIVIGILGAFCLLYLVLRVVISLQDYHVIRGFSGSDFAGSKYYQRLFANPWIAGSIGSTLLSVLVGTLLSLGLGFAGAAMGRGSGNAGKAVAAGLGLLLAFLPEGALNAVFYNSGLLGDKTTGAILMMLIHALPRAGVALAGGALMTLVWPGSVAKPALAAALLGLCVAILGYGPNPYATMWFTTLDDALYRYGLVNGDFSLASAGEVVRGLIAFLLLLAGALVTALLWRGCAPKSARPASAGRRAGASLVAGAIAGGAMLLLAFVFLGASGGDGLETAAPSVASSVAALLLTALLGFGLYFGLLLCAGKLEGRCTFSLILLLIVLSSLTAFSASKYMMARQAGLINTPIPVCLRALFSPLSALVLMVMVLLRPRRAVTCLLMAGGLALLAGAYAMGDTMGSLLYLLRSADTTMGGIIYRTMTMRGGVEPGLVGLLLGLMALPVFAGAFLAVSGCLREKP